MEKPVNPIKKLHLGLADCYLWPMHSPGQIVVDPYSPQQAFADMLLDMRAISRLAHMREAPAHMETAWSEAEDAKVIRYQRVFREEGAADVFSGLAPLLLLTERRFFSVEVAALTDPATWKKSGAPALFDAAVGTFCSSVADLRPAEMLSVLERHKEGFLLVPALRAVADKCMSWTAPKLRRVDQPRLERLRADLSCA